MATLSQHKLEEHYKTTLHSFTAAEQFLSTLDPEAEAFTFQTFNESKTPHKFGARVLHGTLESHWDTLVERNEAGQGIYVTVNQTNLKARNSEAIMAIRAVWQDDDDNYQGSYPAVPTIVTESSPGKYQRFWILDAPDAEAIEDHPLVTQRIIVDYGGDKGCSGIARVMRVAGFFNMKAKYAIPHLVTIDYLSSDRFSWAEIKTTFPPINPLKGQVYQRSNTSVVHPVLERAETTSETFTGKLDSARYHKLLTGQQSQMKMLKWMGFRNIDELFKRGKLRVCSVIGDPDNNPSASLFVTPDGAVVFTDYRGVHKKKSLMLPEVLSYMVNGKGFTVGERVANATWGVRLMIESGVLSEADVRFPGCDGMSEKHLAVWKSIKLLYQCRWRYSDHEGSPIALGREFLAKWSGQSERQTRYLVMDLLKSKHLKTGSKVGTRRYYLPNRRQK